MARLENDRSLSSFAGQFVPLKIITDGNSDWNRWARAYPVDGAGIPRLYVVRADGEQLYGGVGSLPGDQLPQMLITALKQSGRSFSEPEAALLSRIVTVVQQALDQGDTLTAAVALSEVLQLGSPDELGSYAKSAIQIGELYTKLHANLESLVAEAESDLFGSDNPQPLVSLLVLHEAEATFQLFPKSKSAAVAIARELKKNKQYAEPSSQAESLVKARFLAASLNPRLNSRASNAYATVIRRFPGSEVERLARAELAKIDPDAKVLSSDPKPPATHAKEFRTWKTKSGEFQTRAKFVQQKSGKVQLLKEGGEKVVIEITLLSDEDQAFVRKQPSGTRGN